MAICVCELCNKPFTGMGPGLCRDCIRLVDEVYVKARKFIYQNPEKADFTTIIEEVGLPEKALSYLINKGRLEIANKNGVGVKCRACGKETRGSNICEQCRSKLITEKLLARPDSSKGKESGESTGLKKKTAVPLSYDKN